MPRYRVTLEYDGTPFVGWQVQALGASVQGQLTEAIAKFSGETVSVRAAGRTDAGVHAQAQVASATVANLLEGPTLARALNAVLPLDVRVLTVEELPEGFHARFDARSQTYE